jgi:bacterioferritin-associated ferredoxin
MGGFVTKCVCFDVTFEQLHEYVVAHDGCTLADLQREFGCCRGCTLCRPYVKLMLQTGETRFVVDDARLPRFDSGG